MSIYSAFAVVASVSTPFSISPFQSKHIISESDCTSSPAINSVLDAFYPSTVLTDYGADSDASYLRTVIFTISTHSLEDGCHHLTSSVWSEKPAT